MSSSHDALSLDEITKELEQIREERSEAFSMFCSEQFRDESVVCIHNINHNATAKSSLLPAMEYAQACHCYRCKELRKLSLFLRKARQDGNEKEIKELSDRLSSVRSSMLKKQSKTIQNDGSGGESDNREVDQKRVAKLLELSATLRHYSEEALAKGEVHVPVSSVSTSTEETSLSSSIDGDSISDDNDLARPLSECPDNMNSLPLSTGAPTTANTATHADFPNTQERSYLIDKLQSLLRERPLEPGEGPSIPARADPDGVLDRKDEAMEIIRRPDPSSKMVDMNNEKVSLVEQCRSSDPLDIAKGIIRGVEIETEKNVKQECLEMIPSENNVSFSPFSATKSSCEFDERKKMRRTDPEGAIRGNSQSTHNEETREFKSYKQDNDTVQEFSTKPFDVNCAITAIDKAQQKSMDEIKSNKTADPEILPGIEASLPPAVLCHRDEKRSLGAVREHCVVNDTVPDHAIHCKTTEGIDRISSRRPGGIDPDGATIGQHGITFPTKKQSIDLKVEENQMIKMAGSNNCQDLKKGQSSQKDNNPVSPLDQTKEPKAEGEKISADIKSSLSRSPHKTPTEIADLDDNLLLELVKKASLDQGSHGEGKTSSVMSDDRRTIEGQCVTQPNYKADVKRREIQGYTAKRVFQSRIPRGSISRRKDSKIAATVFRSWDLVNDEDFE